MGINVEKVEPLNWDEVLKTHKGSVFLSQAWLEAMRDEDRTPVYFEFREKKIIKAMVGGLERPVGNGPQKQVFFFSGIASNDSRNSFLDDCKIKFLEYAKDNSYARVIFKSYDYHRQFDPCIDKYFPFERVEYIIDIEREKEEIIEGFAKRYRRYIKKAKRLGAVFKYGYSETILDKLIQLMEITREERVSKGYGGYEIFTMPFLEKNTMLNLLNKRAATIYYIEFLEEIVSIQFVVEAAGRAYGLYMGNSFKGYEISAPSLLYYEIALSCKERHFTSYNLGGLPLGAENQGISRIKLFMGANKIKSNEEATDFLVGSVLKFNKYLRIKRFLNKKPIPWIIKKQLLRINDFFLRDMDRY